MCVACGGSTSNDDASGGNGGSAGSGAAGGSGGNGGSSGNAGTGGNGGDNFSACSAPSDCVVIPASCCGSCGAATREDSVAVNKQSASVYQAWTCGEDTACPGCYMPTDANLVATCSAGKCAVVDLLASKATECTDSSECRLRTNQCCECGGAQDAEHLIAVSDSSSLERVVCDPDVGCPECAPPPPDYAEAVCDDGRCTVQWLLGN